MGRIPLQKSQVLSDKQFNAHCETKLVEYNRRKTQAITRHVNVLCRIVETKYSDVVRSLLGGSVKKGTYVNGLSDVDVLLLLNESTLVSSPPAKVIQYVKGLIKKQLPQNEVTAGRLAVTVNYADGSEIQVLLAIRTKDGFQVILQVRMRGINLRNPADHHRQLNVLPTLALV